MEAVRAREKSYPIGRGIADPLRHLDHTIQQGECITLVGPSGSGQSTLLPLIAGLVEGYEGGLEGAAIRGTGRRSGLAFQDHRLFPWLTALENVRIALNNALLSGPEKTDQALSYLALVGLEGFEQAYPGQLSDGMAQRVAIARALVSRPRILLLNEPFAGLDGITRIHMQSELARIWYRENITMIFVTQDVDEAIYLGDRVGVVAPHQGRISAQFAVEIERPRRRTDPAFNNLKARILGALEPLT